MQAMSACLVELSVERIIVELDKMLASNHPQLGLGCLNHLEITNMLCLRSKCYQISLLAKRPTSASQNG